MLLFAFAQIMLTLCWMFEAADFAQMDAYLIGAAILAECILIQ